MSFLLRTTTNPLRTTPLTPTLLRRAFSTTPTTRLARMTIVGRLGADPESHQAASGKEFIRYIVGTDSGPRENRTTSWFRVTSFAQGPSREYLLGLQKGTLVYLEGDASMDVYEAQDGQKRSSLNVVQSKVEVLKRPVAKEEGSA